MEKPIREQGLVLGKYFKEAKAERVDNTGKKWPATPEKWIVNVISCDEDDLDKVTGIKNGTTCEYEVEKPVFDKIKYLDTVNVKYSLVQYGSNPVRPVPISLALIEK